MVNLQRENDGLKQELRDAKAELQELREELEQYHLRRLLNWHKFPRHELQAILDKQQISFQSTTFVTVILVDSGLNPERGQEARYFDRVAAERKTCQVFQNIFSQHFQTKCVLGGDSPCFILGTDVAAENLKNRQSFLKQVYTDCKEAMETLPNGQNLFVAFSDVHSGVENLHEAFYEARMVTEEMMLLEQVGQCRQYQAVADAEPDVGAIEVRINLEKQFYHSLTKCYYARCGAIMTAIIDNELENNYIVAGTFRSRIFSRIETALNTFGAGVAHADAAEDLSELFRDLVACRSAQGIRERSAQLFEKMDAYYQQICTVTERRLERILRYIKENYTDPELSVNGICEKFWISDTYLGRIFKKYTGMGPLQYIQQLRLNRVEELLQRTEKTVEEIAKETGFYSRRVLTRLFKQKMGITPSAFRERF